MKDRQEDGDGRTDGTEKERVCANKPQKRAFRHANPFLRLRLLVKEGSVYTHIHTLKENM